MAPGRPKQRASDATKQASTEMVPVSTPTMQRSPIKQRKMGLSVQQKQALIDNLQLEITERARRLRAQYNLQAQGLRLRIEVRVGRIPTSLRKMKMEDLLLKYAEQQQRATQGTAPPPVPAKDVPVQRSREPATRSAAAPAQRPGRPAKRASDDISQDKENEIENMEHPKKKTRGQQPDRAPVRPAQVLSPTSSNSRLNNIRPASPAKSQIARPGSPLKGAGASRSAIATNMLSNIVEKAKSSRAGTRKVTTTSNTSSSSAGMPPPATRTRRGAAPAAPKAPPSRPATRLGRRVSATSEASDGSTSTVVRKTAASKTTTAATKRKGLASFTKGTASGDAKKTTAAAKPAAPTTTRAGRVLRNRG